LAGDVGSKKSVNEMIEKLDKIGTLDFLINNVGIFGVKPFAQVDDDEWLHYFNVNVLSCVRFCRAYLPRMLKRNSGRILLISSETGLRPISAMVHYSMTKAAQISLARGLAELTKGTKVTVNSVLPGPTLSDGIEEYLKGVWKQQNQGKDAEHQVTLEQVKANYCKETEPTSLLERFIDVAEVASTVLYLCTDLAAAINGNAQKVEGGIIRHI